MADEKHPPMTLDQLLEACGQARHDERLSPDTIGLLAMDYLRALVDHLRSSASPPDEKGEGPSDGFAAWFAAHGSFVIHRLQMEAHDTEKRHTGYDNSGYIAALRKAATELDALSPSRRPGSDGGS